MSFASRLRDRLSSATRDHARRSSSKPRGFRPGLEALDARVVPTTLTVTSNLGFGPGTLRTEIALAQSGDTVDFAPGLGPSIQLMTGQTSGVGGPIELLISKDLNIQGPGAGLLAIDANRGGRAFEIGPGAHVTISGLTIEDGNGTTGGYDSYQYDDYGGGILNEGTLTLSGCTVTGNTARYGGGIYNIGALTIIGSTVTQNTSILSSKYDDLFNLGTLSASSSTIGSKKYH